MVENLANKHCRVMPNQNISAIPSFKQLAFNWLLETVMAMTPNITQALTNIKARRKARSISNFSRGHLLRGALLLAESDETQKHIIRTT